METKQPYEENFLANIIRRRMWRNNQSWTCAFLGQLGSGKSWSACALADHIMSGKFNPKSGLFFRIEDFIMAVKDKKIKTGDAIVLDESGISFSARESMTRKNRALSALFQIMRYKRFCLLLTVPSLSMLDRIGRDVLNGIIETKRINRKEGYCDCSIKLNQLNACLGKVYRKFPRLKEGGVTYRYDTMRIWKPRPEIIKTYEKMKRVYSEGEGGLLQEIADIVNPPKDTDTKDTIPNALCNKCGHKWFSRSKADHPGCSMCGGRRTTRI